MMCVEMLKVEVVAARLDIEKFGDWGYESLSSALGWMQVYMPHRRAIITRIAECVRALRP
jgi:hypothetical protein